MVADQLYKKDFDFTDGNYSDTNIVQKYPKFSGADSKYYDKKSKFHWVYVLYNTRYIDLINTYQHKFNDYDFIFGKKNVSNKCNLICKHIIMRLMFYYFVDTYNNKVKHGKKKNKHKTFKITVPKVAYILHDSDKSKNGGIVKPHFHMIFKFATRVTPSQLSRWTGIKNSNAFESNKKGRYAFENMNAYLIHDASAGKHHYNPKDVHANYDYMKLYHTNHAKWASSRYHDEVNKSKDMIIWLVKQVQHGDLNKQDILKNPKLKYIYADHMRMINDAVQFRQEDVAEHNYELLIKHKFSLSVFYIWGEPGSGKTYFANHLASRISKQHHWSVYKSSSEHPVDDYAGQNIVLLNDVRGTSMTATDWTKLLDHIDMSPNNARFHDKTVSARVIIMTAVEPPKMFFGYLRNIHGNEPLSQFIRRLDEICHVRYVGNNKQILISNVRRLKEPYQVKIGTDKGINGDEDMPILRKTSYVSNPNQNNPKTWKYAINQRDAINKMVHIVNVKNDPKIYHKNERKGLIALNDYLNSGNPKPNVNLISDKSVVIAIKNNPHTRWQSPVPYINVFHELSHHTMNYVCSKWKYMPNEINNVYKMALKIQKKLSK